MHDIAGHIENVLVELPRHLKPFDCDQFNQLLSVYNSEKDKKDVVIVDGFFYNLHFKIYG